MNIVLPISTSVQATLRRWKAAIEQRVFSEPSGLPQNFNLETVGAMTFTPTSAGGSRFQLFPDSGLCFVNFFGIGTIGGVAAPYLQVRMPIAAKYNNLQLYGLVNSDGAGNRAGYAEIFNQGYAWLYRYDGANWTLGADRAFNFNGWYYYEGTE